MAGFSAIPRSRRACGQPRSWKTQRSINTASRGVDSPPTVRGRRSCSGCAESGAGCAYGGLGWQHQSSASSSRTAHRPGETQRNDATSMQPCSEMAGGHVAFSITGEHHVRPLYHYALIPLRLARCSRGVASWLAAPSGGRASRRQEALPSSCWQRFRTRRYKLSHNAAGAPTFPHRLASSRKMSATL